MNKKKNRMIGEGILCRNIRRKSMHNWAITKGILGRFFWRTPRRYSWQKFWWKIFNRNLLRSFWMSISINFWRNSWTNVWNNLLDSIEMFFGEILGWTSSVWSLVATVAFTGFEMFVLSSRSNQRILFYLFREVK